MSDNYTPSMADLRESYVLARTRDGLRTEGVIAAARADANRAIAAHDAELREQIAREIDSEREAVNVPTKKNWYVAGYLDGCLESARIARGKES